MNLLYFLYSFVLKFDKGIKIGQRFHFVLRSVFGRELKYLSCVLKTQTCHNCPLRLKCAYSVVFEAPIDRDNEYLPGRSNAPLPYVFQVNYSDIETDTVNVELILIGKGGEYAPYVLLSLSRAGQNGLFKERIKYTVRHAECNGEEIDMSAPHTPKFNTFVLNESKSSEYKNLRIEFKTPFRYKKQGKYTSDIDFQDIMLAAARRLNGLSGFYGDGSQTDTPSVECDTERSLSWVENNRYSVRQKSEMTLGGIMGRLNIHGNFSYHALSLLQSAQLFNIGKSISFGLGLIAVTEV
jgi:hypothetical protein